MGANMSETDDEWEKVRHMVQSTPVGVPRGHALPPVADAKERIHRHRRHKTRALPVLAILVLVIAGIFFAFQFGPRQLQAGGARSSETATGSKDAEAVKPVQDIKAADNKTASNPPNTVAIKKGLQTISVRTGPSSKKPSVAKLIGGDQVEPISESAGGGWVKIRFKVDGRQGQGWVKKTQIEN